jgi:hypothetical protein
MDMLFEQAIESYPWVSEIQKESYLNWVQEELRTGKQPELPINTAMAYLFQKIHDMNEYWRETFATQISILQDIIHQNQKDLTYINENLGLFRDAIRTQTILLETLTKTLKGPGAVH